MPYVEFSPNMIYIALDRVDDAYEIKDPESICRAIDLLIDKMSHFKHNNVIVTEKCEKESKGNRIFYHIIEGTTIAIYVNCDCIRINLFNRPPEPDEDEVDLQEYKELLESLKPELCQP